MADDTSTPTPNQTFLGLTAEDDDTLRSLSRSEAQDWFLSQSEYHVEYARTLRAMYNERNPIHRFFPPEVIMEIFGKVHPEHRREARLLHVCRLWRNLLNSTPEFWADMLRSRIDHDELGSDDTERGELQCFKISLTRSAPRHICLDILHFSIHSSRILTPHTHRISSLSITIRPSDAEHLFHMLRSGMPVLNSLVVAHKPRRPGSSILPHQVWRNLEDLTYEEDTLPSLRNLRVSAMFVVPCLHVNSLRTLSIGCNDCSDERCSVESGMHNLDTFLRFLEGCRLLESLHFLAATEPSPGRRHSQLHAVELPNLRELAFTDAQSSWVSEILHKLVYPSTAAVKVQTMPDHFTDIPRHLRSLPALPTMRKVAIQFNSPKRDSSTCIVQAWPSSQSDEPPQIDLQASLRTFQGVVPEVSQIFGSALITDLRLWIPTSTIYSGLQMRSHMVAFLASFPNVVHLTVKRANPHDLFSALGSRTSSGEPILASLCTLLVHWGISSQTGEIEFAGTCQFIKQTLRQRASLGHSLQKSTLRQFIKQTLRQRASLGHSLQKFTLRCEETGRLGPGVDAEKILNRLKEDLEDVADRVQIRASP